MGMFSKSKLVHPNKAAEEKRLREESRAIEERRGEEAQARREYERDQQIQRDIAKHLLRHEGVNEPEKPSRMDCAPDPMGPLNAAKDGVRDGMLSTAPISAAKDLAGGKGNFLTSAYSAVGGGIYGAAKKMWDDSNDIKQCMKNQDDEFKESSEKYEQQLRNKNPDYGKPFAPKSSVDPNVNASYDGKKLRIGFGWKY